MFMGRSEGGADARLVATRVAAIPTVVIEPEGIESMQRELTTLVVLAQTLIAESGGNAVGT